ncbi:MAG TPA: YbaL family putative K(+) efflux transporter [Steroidobacteraceae bacterium]|nr:YbaL family putative K(+) efflux transporter [Steroidobacteraceae bacterium]
MPHETDLIALLAIGFVLAFAFGFLAARLRLPPLVGYLLAGVAVGPHTPGFVGDTKLASQLAEIGVILLMFGVGLHFSLSSLRAVRRIAVPGAIAQIAVATLIGLLVARTWGWSSGAGLVFGLALSVASTVVLLRALEERGELETENGRIAVGWLIVEDLVTVLALVMLPALAAPLGAGPGNGVGTVDFGSLGMALALTIVKIGGFIALMLVGGKRLIPWLLAQVARTGSRELFTLAVLAIALGVAYGSAELFDVSFALGAFFAGVMLAESDFSHQAAADSLPLQEAFAVLFFVSVGMLFDPTIVLREPLALATVLLVILVGKSLAAFAIVLAFGYSARTALTVSASLAQIGEFSFILAGLGVALGLLPEEGRDLILAGALLSIALNPFVFATVEPVSRWLQAHPRLLTRLERSAAHPGVLAAPLRDATLQDHAIIVGYGRVGSVIGEAFDEQGIPFVVIERDRALVESLHARGVRAIYGDGGAPEILDAARVDTAKLILIAVPDGVQALRTLEVARRRNPGIETAVRTHSASILEQLERRRVGKAVMAERELAASLRRYALAVFGKPGEPAARGEDRTDAA